MQSGRLLLAMACFSGMLFGQQSNRPSIPDNVTWEPGIEYAPGGAKSESLFGPKGQEGPIRRLFAWRMGIP